MTPVRLKPAAPRSQVKHSTTEPLRSPIQSLCFGSRQLLQRGCDVHPVTYMYYLRIIHTVQMSDLFEQEQPSLAHGI